MNTSETKPGREADDNWGFGGGKILSGLVVVIVGLVLLLRKLNTDIPGWIISWEMLLIVIGLYIGARHSFRNWGWLIPVVVGGVFLVDNIVPELNFRPYFWPVAIIVVGLVIMFNPRRACSGRWRGSNWRGDNWMGDKSGISYADKLNSEDYIDSVSIFGGIEKNIVSKDFRGGDVVTFFGGSSINMSQADIRDRAVLELTQVFGGAQLIIPANWKLRSEMVNVFGSVEDKRTPSKEEGGKTLVLRGTSVFGGIEIRSF